MGHGKWLGNMRPDQEEIYEVEEEDLEGVGGELESKQLLIAIKPRRS